jgi:Skp family chaperone for outer membrane proteins
LSDPILVLDLARVLDESKAGRDASRALHEAWAASAQDEAARRTIEERREQVRAALLAKLEAVVRDLAAERGASVVVDAKAVVACRDGVDVTAEVLRRADAAIPPGSLPSGR